MQSMTQTPKRLELKATGRSDISSIQRTGSEIESTADFTQRTARKGNAVSVTQRKNNKLIQSNQVSKNRKISANNEFDETELLKGLSKQAINHLSATCNSKLSDIRGVGGRIS